MVSSRLCAAGAARSAGEPEVDRALEDRAVWVALAEVEPGLDVTVLADDGGSGGGTSKPVFSVLSVAKATDRLSPDLLKWTAAGTHFPQVVVTVTPKYQLP